MRHPVKRTKGGELAELDHAFNAVIRGVHAVAERADGLLQLEHDRTVEDDGRERVCVVKCGPLITPTAGSVSSDDHAARTR